MKGRQVLHNLVVLTLVQLQQLGVQGTRKIADVHGFGFGRNILRLEETLQRAEIVRILALMPVNLRKPQDGRDIAAVQRKRLGIMDLRQGILILAQVIVAQHGQDGRRRIVPVERLQRRNGFFRTVELAVYLVTGLGYGL